MNNEKTMYEKTRARSASVFIHCFRVFGYPGETRARVVYMASQMNQQVALVCGGLNRMFSFADLNRILNQA